MESEYTDLLMHTQNALVINRKSFKKFRFLIARDQSISSKNATKYPELSDYQWLIFYFTVDSSQISHVGNPSNLDTFVYPSKYVTLSCMLMLDSKSNGIKYSRKENARHTTSLKLAMYTWRSQEELTNSDGSESRDRLKACIGIC
ncbi:hypothetical protein RF11_09685 [Thelohanellus kitauei]|uniref:Uncharacterized protein n=1 Tax=Thelohanellus kitauei TaxID=669202 RepID=A0A0C2N912_THEKT|nr:hypothetical protein RF11_09685 [Thelohanellus kitauei]